MILKTFSNLNYSTILWKGKQIAEELSSTSEPPNPFPICSVMCACKEDFLPLPRRCWTAPATWPGAHVDNGQLLPTPAHSHLICISSSSRSSFLFQFPRLEKKENAVI